MSCVQAKPKTGTPRWNPQRELNDRERAAIRPREQLSIEAWATRHLRVVEGPLVGYDGEPARFSPEGFPLQSTVMDAIGDSRWSRVLLMTAPQAFGKTQCAALPTLLHALEHRRVSALYVAANLDLAVTQWRRKIQRALLADETLAELLPPMVDQAGNRVRRDFTNGTSLHCAGADSAGALSGYTVPVIVCDDVQAYPATLPGFGHPADLAFKRSEALPADATIHVAIGTAGTIVDYLWRSMLSSALYVPLLPCPRCGAFQMLSWDRFEYDETNVESAKRQTRMRCVSDGHDFEFDDLHPMLSKHRWVSVPPDQDWVTKPPEEPIDITAAQEYPTTRRNTNVAGFWCNALYWPWGRTWGQRAADYVALRADPDKLKDHQQHVRVIPWAEPELDEHALTVEDLEQHAVEHHCGTVPVEADLVTLTIDVHANFLYFIARAWNRAEGTSWLVEADHPGVHGVHKGEALGDAERTARVGHGIREALEALYARALEGWPTVKPDGAIERLRKPALVLVDGRFRPDVVGPLCRLRSTATCRWIMTMGSAQSRKPKPIWPRTPFRDKRGYRYREINVDAAKLALRDLLAIPTTQPGGWRTYGDRDLSTYHRHLCSEHYVPKREGANEMMWRTRPGGGPNHWWDCEVLQVAAAMACGVRLLGSKDRAATPRKPVNRPRITMPDGRPYVVTRR